MRRTTLRAPSRDRARNGTVAPAAYPDSAATDVHTAPCPTSQLPRYFAVPLCQLWRIVLQARGQTIACRRAGEWRAPCEHLVERHSQTENVGPRVHLLAPYLLRRHIARCAHHYS